jgi:transcriptional regulator of aromatic amino acid metabolism
VRVIAAKRRCSLHALALRGTFRQDLYFRLNVRGSTCGIVRTV